MSSRIERHIAATLAIYNAEPADARAALESGLAAAARAIADKDRLRPETKAALRDLVEAIALEGFMSARGWAKVRAALAAAAPEFYEKVKGILPRDAGDKSLPF